MTVFLCQMGEEVFCFVRLFFGCQSSPCICDTLSQAICWLARNNYGVQTIFHLLEILSVGLPDACNGKRTMAVLSLIFDRLHIPLAHHKCIGPTVCLEYLDIVLDSVNMEARLPLDKVQRISNIVF